MCVVIRHAVGDGISCCCCCFHLSTGVFLVRVWSSLLIEKEKGKRKEMECKAWSTPLFELPAHTHTHLFFFFLLASAHWPSPWSPFSVSKWATRLATRICVCMVLKRRSGHENWVFFFRVCVWVFVYSGKRKAPFFSFFIFFLFLFLAFYYYCYYYLLLISLLHHIIWTIVVCTLNRSSLFTGVSARTHLHDAPIHFVLALCSFFLSFFSALQLSFVDVCATITKEKLLKVLFFFF